MAKKKSNNQQKHSQDQTPKTQEQMLQQESFESELTRSESERFESLKSLNSLLLKETRERRQQVDELKQSKEGLESELTRSDSERKLLSAELTGASEDILRVELEKGLMGVFMTAQMKEMGGLERENEDRFRVLESRVEELSREIAKEREVSTRVKVENDEMKCEIGVKDEEVNVLRMKVFELEERERKIVNEFVELENSNRELLVEKRERKSVVEGLMNEKMLLERKLDELVKDIVNEREVLSRVKVENEELKCEIGLKNEQINVLRVKAMEFEEEERKMVDEFTKLENDYRELVVEKREKEGAMESLMNEKMLLESKVKDLLKDIASERKVSGHVKAENGELKCEISMKDEEANVLRVKVLELDERERKIFDEFRKLENDYSKLVVEKRERESFTEGLMNEKMLVERKLDELMMFSEALKREIGEITKKKEDVEVEKNGQMMIIQSLEREVSELNEKVSILGKGSENLLAKVLNLGNANEELLEQKHRISMEFNVLKDQNKENEMRINVLLEEKSLSMKSLEESLNAFEVQKQKLDELIRDKGAVEDVKAVLDNVVVELQKELNEVKGIKLVEMEKKVAMLESALKSAEQVCNTQVEEYKRMLSETGNYKDEINAVVVERDNAQRNLDRERENVRKVNLKVSEMKKRIEESVKEIEQMRGENETFNKVETRFENLINEKNLAQNNLENAQRAINSVRAESESVRAKSELALTLLKKTRMVLVCKANNNTMDRKEDIVTNEEVISEEIQPYVAELEAIKDAFNSKEANMVEMMTQLEFHQKSATEAHKKKSLWAMVSSASAVFAAASVAYAAHVR